MDEVHVAERGAGLTVQPSPARGGDAGVAEHDSSRPDPTHGGAACDSHLADGDRPLGVGGVAIRRGDRRMTRRRPMMAACNAASPHQGGRGAVDRGLGPDPASVVLVQFAFERT